jgi:translation elongation factor EF-Tu-like GTPase
LSAFFQINESFHITGRGLVAAGDILSGTIKVGDIANIEIDGQRYNLKILGVETGDRLSEEEHFAGLVFKSDSAINLDGVKLNSQVIEINRPYDRS